MFRLVKSTLVLAFDKTVCSPLNNNVILIVGLIQILSNQRGKIN